MIGQPPLENGLGKKYRVTADTIDIEVANQYQLGKVNQTDLVSTAENVSRETFEVDDIKNNKEGSNG